MTSWKRSLFKQQAKINLWEENNKACRINDKINGKQEDTYHSIESLAIDLRHVDRCKQLGYSPHNNCD